MAATLVLQLGNKSDTFPEMIPSHTFICWLTMKDRLLTRARLEIWGVCSDVLCLLCSATLGSQDHLFFEFPFPQRVWKVIMEFSVQCNPEFGWEKIVSWAVNTTEEGRA